MKEITFHVEKDLATCQELWEEFSPKQLLPDSWSFRYIRHAYQPATPHFLVGSHGGAPIGILPLQYNTEKKYLQAFGDYNSDDTVVWLKPGFKQRYRDFYDAIDQPVVLSLGRFQHTYSRELVRKVKPKFILDLRGYANVDEYMDDLWREKDRRKMRKEIAKLHSTHRVEIKQTTCKELERLITFNLKRFGENSSFSKTPHLPQIFRDYCAHFETDFVSIRINGRIQAVGMSIIYNGTYYGLNSGSNRDINNLGKMLYLQKIQRAIELGLDRYHAGRGDYGNWKQKFAFSEVPQYELRKGVSFDE